MNEEIEKFEKYITLGPIRSAIFLGVSYSCYASWKNGTRPIPKYIMRHIETIYAMPKDELKKQLYIHVIEIYGY